MNLGNIEIPINAATKSFAILAKRGAGKSYTGAVMAEEFYKSGIPFIVFDPIDVWWGLQLHKDGKQDGLPVVVFGTEHADILIDRDMGRRIAQSVVKENISCVISTFGMNKTAQRHLIAEFAEELLNINNTPRHVFIEEAHEFVPQRVSGGMGKTFSAVEALVVMGRNRGIGVTLINQRAATVNKDVLTQIDTLLAFRNTAPQDRKALQEWVEAHSAEGDFEAFIKSLPSLPTGEGWIWSPEFLGIFERIKIRERETFHPDREKIGDNFVMPELTQVNIQDFIEKFAKQKEEKIVEPKVLPKEDKAVEDTRDTTIIGLRKDLIEQRNSFESLLVKKDTELSVQLAKLAKIKEIVDSDIIAISSVALSPSILPSSRGVSMWLEKLGTAMSGKILKFLAEKAPIKFTRSQIGLQTGYSPNSGSFANAMSLLKRNKLIVKEGDLYWISPDL